MTFLRNVIAALVAVAGLVLVAPAPAFACSCVGGSAAQFVEWADVVVVGEVTGITPPPQREVMSSGDPATYDVAVDRVLAGKAGETVEVLSAVSGASCGLEGIEVGREYVIFAAYQDIGGEPTKELWASLCGGTAPASGSFVADVEAVTGSGSPPEPAPIAAGPASTDRSSAPSGGVPGWAWAGGGLAVAAVVAGALLARRRTSGG
jgi:hypothetical protein